MRYVYQGVCKDGNGKVIPDATVSVYEAGTTTEAVVYEDETTLTEVEYVTAGSDGHFIFWVDDTDYSSDSRFKIVIEQDNFIPKTFDDLVILAELNAAVFDSHTAHMTADGTSHSDVVLNNTHRTSAGTDHSDVGLNNTHRTSAGTDHSDVGLANTHRGLTNNPHSVTKAQVGLTNVTDAAQIPLSYLETVITDSDTKVPSSSAVIDLIGGGTTANAYIANVRNFGAIGNGTTNDTAAIVAARDSLLTTGGILYFPGGTYLSDDLTITTTDTDDDGARISIDGDGTTASVFLLRTGGTNAITLTGANTGSGMHSYQSIKNIRITREDALQTGAGIAGNALAYMTFSNVYVRDFAVGVYLTDFLSSSFYSCQFKWNLGACRFERNAAVGAYNSHPNAINFYGCEIGINADYGIWNIGGNLSIFGGAIEGNGISGVAATKFGILSSDAGAEISNGLTITGTHFEYNKGDADIMLYNTAYDCSYNITGCTFIRNTLAAVDSTIYTTNNIQIVATDGLDIIVAVTS